MNLGPRLRVGAVGAGVILLVAGCTSGTADAPPSSSVASPTASPSVVDPSSLESGSSSAASPSANPSPTRVEQSTPSSSGLSPQEAADRAAIEAQWAKFWKIYNDVVRTPAELRDSALDQVSIDPIKAQILEAAQRFESEGIDYYGTVVQHPYWTIPVDGQSVAVMRDCQDQSSYGSVWVATGEKRSVGVSKNNIQAGFVRGNDGIWRVRTFDHLADEPC